MNFHKGCLLRGRQSGQSFIPGAGGSRGQRDQLFAGQTKDGRAQHLCQRQIVVGRDQGIQQAFQITHFQVVEQCTLAVTQAGDI